MKRIILCTLLMFLANISFSQISLKTYRTKDKLRIRYSYYEAKNPNKMDAEFLVIALHWGWSGEIPDYYSKEFLEGFILPIFKNEDVIIVAPDCPESSWTKEKSINAILELREFFKEKHNIDNNKIIITGFSLGGIGTWYFATQYSSLFSYSIPIAGYPKMDWLKNIDNVNISAVNSANDELIPYSKIETVKSFVKGKNYNIEFKTIYGVAHYDIKFFINPVKESLFEILNEY